MTTLHTKDTNDLLEDIDSGLQFEEIKVSKDGRNLDVKHITLQIKNDEEGTDQITIPFDISSVTQFDTCSGYTWQNQEEFHMFMHLDKHIKEWKPYFASPDNFTYTRLNGNSNACYKVSLKEFIVLQQGIPRSVLYRKYQQQLIDKRVEQAIFQAKHEDKSGPKLFFQSEEYRIEGFYEGRPISLWEMRNPTLMQMYSEHICEFNFNSLSNKYVHRVSKLDQSNLFIHQILYQQGPDLLKKIDSMMKLCKESKQSHNHYKVDIAQRLKDTFLFEGYIAFFSKLVPISSYSSFEIASNRAPAQIPEDNPFPTVLSHNDTHQNNILMKLSDNKDILLIDNEYAGWNPMAMDLAYYINEVMIDNSYPGKNGVQEYPENAMSVKEQENLMESYLLSYWRKFMPLTHKESLGNDENKFVNRYLPVFKRQVWQCAVLNNFFWGVWALNLLNGEECLQDKIFNFDFANARCNFYNHFSALLANLDKESQVKE